MTDQQKETSSVHSKEGTSLQEEGIGKEFLSSWKSISITDDDEMDFSFDSVSKGKKKTFDFGKLDMDFNLDGEFDKISSFKMDMSDLDFTCSPKKSVKSKENKGSDLDFTCSLKKPAKSMENKGGDMSDLDLACSPKKPAKSKESKGGECSGAKEGKRHSFDFNFDFNEMDSFNLDSSLLKGDTTSTTNLNKKGDTSREIDSEAAKEPETKSDEHECASNDNMILKPLSSETVETSKVEIMVGNQRDLGFIQDDSVSKASYSGKLDVLVEARTSTLSTEEKDQEREIPVKRKSSESISLDDNSPSKSVDQNDSNQYATPDQHTEVYSPGTKVITGSGSEQNVINNKATYVDPDGVKLPLEDSSPPQIKKLESSDGEAIKFGSSTQAEATNDPQPVKSDSSYENNTTADMSNNISLDNDVKENQKSTLEDHLATASSKPVVDKVIMMKHKEIKGMKSEVFCKPEDEIPLKHNSSTSGTKGISFGYKRTGDMQLGSIIKARESFKSNDSECGTRLASNSTPPTSKSVRDELILHGGKDDLKIPSNAREAIVSDGIHSGGKLAETKQPIRKEVKKSKFMVLNTDMSTKDINILSSQVNPSSLTEKTARHATKMPVNLEAQNSDTKSFQNLRVTIEENKLSSIKAAKIGFRTSKSVEINKGFPTSIRQKDKETNSSVNSEHMEIRGITAAKIDHPTDGAENQKYATPFLKRKNPNEISEADLVPLRSLKRLSHSPSEIRNSEESPEKVVEKVESRPNSLICNTPTFELQHPPEINLMEVKLSASVFVEDNSNIEKAEAYTKELEEISNMLKKKHEEAKELIVRAVVNNNNLLMLNHPIYEEKIRKVQKLALHSMSKGIQT